MSNNNKTMWLLFILQNSANKIIICYYYSTVSDNCIIDVYRLICGSGRPRN